MILKNIFHIARRFKLATTFNALGLVVAFATFYVLMTQIDYQLSYNHELDDYNRLYRLESDFVYNEWEFSDLVCHPFVDALKNIPQVESLSLILNIKNGNQYYYTIPIHKGDNSKDYPFSYCNSTGVSTLTSRIIDGQIEWTEEDSATKKQLIIPASIALDYFGTTQAADSMMDSYKVLGVYEDFPENSEFGSWNCVFAKMPDDFDTYGTNCIYKCVLKLKEPASNLDSLNATVKHRIIAYMDSIGWEQFVGDEDIQTAREVYHKIRFKLTPLSKSYFEYSSFSFGNKGYMVMLIIVGLGCLLVIIIATINFLNFTLAESPMRMRGLNTRLVMGDTRQHLRRVMVGECVVISIFASLIALLLCAIISQLPWGTWGLTEGNLSPVNHWLLSLVLIAIAAVAGIVAGSYPATFATSFAPALALKGNFALTPQGKKLRTVLVCIQLCFSILMAIYIGILMLQSRYIFHTSNSYNKNQILTTYLPYSEDQTSNNRLFKALTELPQVETVSFSNGPIGSTDGHETENTSEGDIPMRYSLMSVDTAYLRTMGIKIIEGRDFLPSDTAAAIINEATLKKWKWMKPGKMISTTSGEQIDSALVVGVCEDFRFGTTRISSHKPFILLYEKDKSRDFLNVSIVAGADQDKALDQVQSVVRKHFKQNDLQLKFFDDTLRDAYQIELRYFRQLYLLAIACLLITLVGVLCLTIFETEYRRKEIGIRKVAGATTGEIVGMFCRRYGWLLLISSAIAVPLAIIASWLTLDHFAEHVSISSCWWVFPIGLLVVGIATIGIVALQSWRAGHENPVNNIKNE